MQSFVLCVTAFLDYFYSISIFYPPEQAFSNLNPQDRCSLCVREGERERGGEGERGGEREGGRASARAGGVGEKVVRAGPRLLTDLAAYSVTIFSAVTLAYP